MGNPRHTQNMPTTREPFRYRQGQPANWFHDDPGESNQYCPYCCAYVGRDARMPSDKEHLIARRFVPQGYLEGTDFNFIFRACIRCNQEKAQAERHVSSITLYNSPARALDERLDEIARRKAAHDYHPDKPGVPVHAAGQTHDLTFGGTSVRMTFNLISPPQANEDAICLLACRHIQGLFALMTTEDPRERTKTKVLPPSQGIIFGHYIHSDWGNERIKEAMRRVQDWPCYANISSAKGHFKATLRRSPDGSDWFWALEWNMFLRVIGGISATGAAPITLDNLPQPSWYALPDGRTRVRQEVPLPEHQDTLFTGSVDEN
jgi:hypothetical protein